MSDSNAFPWSETVDATYGGLTKREYYAVRFVATQINMGWSPREAAQRALLFADALILELSK